MCVLKQRGSDVFIRGTFIGNIHQDPSILPTLWWWRWCGVCGKCKMCAYISVNISSLCCVSVQGWAVDGCPASSMSCPLPPLRGADWACSAHPGPLIGRTDAGCSLWAAAPARTPPPTGWRPAAQPEGSVTRSVVRQSLEHFQTTWCCSTCIPHVWWSVLRNACYTRPPTGPEPDAPTEEWCHGAVSPNEEEGGREEVNWVCWC